MGSGSQLSVKKCVRAPLAGGTATSVFFGLGKINFLRSWCANMNRRQGIANKRRQRRANLT